MQNAIICPKTAAVGLSQTSHPEELTDSFLEQVRHNNEVFSAFRTHRMQNDIARQLTDGKGHLKSFQQFSRDVEPLTGKYCRNWLQTEYNTAVIRAHRAADWKHFETEKDVYPNLRWMPTTSAEPDPVHESFWSRKLTLPVDDPFWGHHHPGERWGCKCTCEQTDEPVNDTLGVRDMEKQTSSPGLSGNPGKTGQLFSEDHPYYPKNCQQCQFNKGLSNTFSILFRNQQKDCQHCKAFSEAINGAKSNDIGQSLINLYNLSGKDLVTELQKITSSKVFKKVESGVWSAIDKRAEDYKNLLAVARKAVKNGNEVFILPNPGKGKTADCIFRRKSIYKVYDVKTISGENSISSRLNDSVGQTHRVILNITSQYDPRHMVDEIRRFMQKNPETVEIIVYRGNKTILVYRKSLDNNFEREFRKKFNE